jgi:hypothetical protein
MIEYWFYLVLLCVFYQVGLYGEEGGEEEVEGAESEEVEVEDGDDEVEKDLFYFIVAVMNVLTVE